MAQDFLDEVKMHAKKQGLYHMGVSILERHSVSFTTRFWQTWTFTSTQAPSGVDMSAQYDEQQQPDMYP